MKAPQSVPMQGRLLVETVLGTERNSVAAADAHDRTQVALHFNGIMGVLGPETSNKIQPNDFGRRGSGVQIPPLRPTKTNTYSHNLFRRNCRAKREHPTNSVSETSSQIPRRDQGPTSALQLQTNVVRAGAGLPRDIGYLEP